jgi:hypothetical protein
MSALPGNPAIGPVYVNALEFLRRTRQVPPVDSGRSTGRSSRRAGRLLGQNGRRSRHSDQQA